MSRKTKQYNPTNSSFSHSMPALSRGSSRSPPQLAPRLVQNSLMDNIHSESLQPDHGNASPKGLGGRESANGGGPGKSAINGGTEGQFNDESSAGSDQDDDEDDDDDDDDENDGGDDDVTSPAGVNPLLPEVNSEQCLLAGSLKRSYEDADVGDGVSANDELEGFGLSSGRDEEPDYPRKKIPRHISTTTQGILAYAEPRFANEKTDDDDDDDDDDGDDGDEDEMVDDDDDGNITDEEEAAIIDEFEDEEYLTGTGPLDSSSMAPAEPDTRLEVFEDNGLFDDLDGEIFDAMCNDPRRFDDLQDQSAFDWNPFTAESDNDLFSVHPSPGVTPDTTPRASISGPDQFLHTTKGCFSSEDDQDEASEDEVPSLSPFFEMGNAALKHLVSTEGKGGWSDETDDDADLMKYFFSSADDESGEDTIQDGDDETDDDDDDALTDGGETTDEEEDLPVPVPQTASKLRRASAPSIRPQIVDTNHDGPELCSWVADPSRPICVIEGSKQTFLIPDAYKRLSFGGESDSTTSNQWIPMEESESEQSTMPMAFDPTLSGLTGVEGGILNGSDILGPPEAFYPFMSEGNDMFSDIFNEEDYDVDEFEAGLEINDFLDLSSEDEGATSEGGKDIQISTEGMSDDPGEDGEEEDEEEEDDDGTANGDASADMLSIWDKVSVTAFRKRQIQHNQKLAVFNASQYGAPGYNKGKEGRLSETITPTKKRRVRQKFLSSNRGGALGTNPTTRKKLTR